MLYRGSGLSVASGMMMLWTNPASSGSESGNLAPVRAEPVLLRRWVITRMFIVLGCFSLRLALAADAPVEKTKGSAANSTAACLECHSDATLKTKKAGRLVSLFADQTLLAKSAHRSLE